MEFFIVKIAHAIARQEGFFVKGSLPQRHNNPGDLTDETGNRVFPNIDAGWRALYQQVNDMYNGASKVYNPEMTLQEMGMLYSGGDPNWSKNVAAMLGVDENDTLADIKEKLSV